MTRTFEKGGVQYRLTIRRPRQTGQNDGYRQATITNLTTGRAERACLSGRFWLNHLHEHPSRLVEHIYGAMAM